MKKFIFSAFAVVAFAGSSFASNEVFYNEQFEQTESDKKPCTHYIIIQSADGTSYNLKSEGGAMSFGDCKAFGEKILSVLIDGGIEFDSESVTLVWG